jgi:ABC-type nitrate/sulfonate/bicarbonate transport system ATPase subunit
MFAREGLTILDDVLSSLDASTERHITSKLIDPKGLFKQLGSTVILITHAGRSHKPTNDLLVTRADNSFR